MPQRPLPIALLLAALAALPLAAAPAAAQDAARRTIHVQGTGTVRAEPDMASIVAGVVTQAADARQALAANNEAVERLFRALGNFGVAAADMQTSDFSIYPQMDHGREREGGPPRIVGYQVNNRVTVRVRDLAALGRLLDALIEAGANSIDGVSFGIEEIAALQDEARRRAVADARRRAALYAEAAGVALGPVLEVHEQGFARPPPQPMMAMAEARDAGAVPVARGEQELVASVAMTFAIE